MDIQNLEYNGNQARGLGFDGITDELVQNLKPGQERYTAERVLAFDNERVLYSLPYTLGKDDRYYLNEYSATRFFNINISHPDPAKVPFDSAALEERMKAVRWRDVQPAADEDGVVTYGQEIDDLLKDLKKLGDWNIGRKYRDKLEAKYFLGTKMELVMAHPGEARDRYSRTQTFRVQTKRKGQDEASETITAKEAYNMLCGRPVLKFTVSDFREPGETWYLLRFDPKLKTLDGNFKVQSFVPKYGYDLDKVFDKKYKDGSRFFPFREFEDRVSRDSVASALKRGELAPVTYYHEDKPVRYFVSPYLDNYSLNIYGQDREVVFSNNLREHAAQAVEQREKRQEEFHYRLAESAAAAMGLPQASSPSEATPATPTEEEKTENPQLSGELPSSVPDQQLSPEKGILNDDLDVVPVLETFHNETFLDELEHGAAAGAAFSEAEKKGSAGINASHDVPSEKQPEGATIGKEAGRQNKTEDPAVAKKPLKKQATASAKPKRSAGRGR